MLTPPLEDRILASITRDRLLEVCGAREAVCTMDDVRRADEAFIASTVREVMPIAAVDEIELPAAPGPVTESAHAQFARHVEQELGSLLVGSGAGGAAARLVVHVPEHVAGRGEDALYGSAYH